MSNLNDILDKPADLEGTLGDIPPTLQDLFDRDPLSLNDRDIEVIILHLRQERTSFLNEERDAKDAKRRPNYKKAAKENATKLNVDEIDL